MVLVECFLVKAERIFAGVFVKVEVVCENLCRLRIFGLEFVCVFFVCL